jgi:hypothetical protein
MVKRFLLMIVVSAIALTWTQAGAATCTSWRVSGGSYVCSSWRTGSVIFDVVLTENCPPGGCFVSADAVTNNSIAFCQDPSDSSIHEVNCTDTVDFGGSGQCHDIHSNTTGGGHTTGTHKCEFGPTEFGPNPSDACQTACTAANSTWTVVDVTPITMTTSENYQTFSGGAAPAATTTSSKKSFSCGTSPGCFITESCSIAQSAIAYQAQQTYSCVVTSASGFGGG